LSRNSIERRSPVSEAALVNVLADREVQNDLLQSDKGLIKASSAPDAGRVDCVPCFQAGSAETLPSDFHHQRVHAGAWDPPSVRSDPIPTDRRTLSCRALKRWGRPFDRKDHAW
jgi:hypothetical protein